MAVVVTAIAYTDIKPVVEFANRVKEIFGDKIPEKEISTYHYIVNEYGLEKSVDINTDMILKTVLGSVEFYSFISKGSVIDIPCHSKRVEITTKHKQLESVEFRGIVSMVVNYIETGKRDYYLVLSKIFAEEENILKIKQLAEEKEVKNIEKTLIKEGRLKIDEKYAKHFNEYKIDKEGYHLAL